MCEHKIFVCTCEYSFLNLMCFQTMSLYAPVSAELKFSALLEAIADRLASAWVYSIIIARPDRVLHLGQRIC
jgi:hypothetical protein